MFRDMSLLNESSSDMIKGGSEMLYIGRQWNGLMDLVAKYQYRLEITIAILLTASDMPIHLSSALMRGSSAFGAVSFFHSMNSSMDLSVFVQEGTLSSSSSSSISSSSSSWYLSDDIFSYTWPVNSMDQ